jgi:signal transduction histidine kinase
VEHEARLRDAKFHLAQEWPRVVANEPMLEQILTQLVTNALNYVPPDRTPEIVISAETKNGTALLRVADNGVGIPPGQIDRVFTPFTRFPQPIQVPGTGMGLAIVKKAAERMNGAVGVDSTPDKGSCFWLQLRAA